MLSYILFFILFRKAEKKHNVHVERFPGGAFPQLKGVRKMIKTSTEPQMAEDFMLALSGLYFSRFLFIAPILIYFISAFFE
jgi:hypothetical protein